jgi:hypothetical protein
MGVTALGGKSDERLRQPASSRVGEVLQSESTEQLNVG